MKHIIILAGFILCFAACKQEQEATTNATNGSTPIAVAPENQVDAASPTATNTGSTATAVAPDMNMPKVKALLNGWWVIEFWVDAKNDANKGAMRGHWMKFEEDGTYTSGMWDKQTAQGVWAVTMDQNRTLLTLDSNNDAEDMQFNMQGITADEDAMSWSGTRAFDMPHLLCKVIQMGSRPTKEQFEQTF